MPFATDIYLVVFTRFLRPFILHLSNEIGNRFSMIIYSNFQCLRPSTQNQLYLPATIQTKHSDASTANGLECWNNLNDFSHLFLVSLKTIICIPRWMVDSVQLEELRCLGLSFWEPRKLLISDHTFWKNVVQCIPLLHLNSPCNDVTRNKPIWLDDRKCSSLPWIVIPFQPSTVEEPIHIINKEFFRANLLIIAK